VYQKIKIGGKTMNNLKKETLKKCFSLLGEFINETPGASSKKDVAILALTQLKRITAGTEIPGDDGQTILGPTCIGVPRADR
jgi:hypothetical protein